MKENYVKRGILGFLKTLKTQELPGAVPPGSPPGRCPWTQPGTRMSGRLDPTPCTLLSTILVRHDFDSVHHPVTNPAHANLHTRNEGMDRTLGLKIHIGPLNKRYGIWFKIILRTYYSKSFSYSKMHQNQAKLSQENNAKSYKTYVTITKPI